MDFVNNIAVELVGVLIVAIIVFILKIPQWIWRKLNGNIKIRLVTGDAFPAQHSWYLHHQNNNQACIFLHFYLRNRAFDHLEVTRIKAEIYDYLNKAWKVINELTDGRFWYTRTDMNAVSVISIPTMFHNGLTREPIHPRGIVSICYAGSFFLEKPIEKVMVRVEMEDSSGSHSKKDFSLRQYKNSKR